MKTIYKYQLNTADIIDIEMPIDSEILTVQAQHGKPCIWAMVDDNGKFKTRRFEIYGTGHEIRPLEEYKCRKYIGTYQLLGGGLIFHVFEIVPSSHKIFLNKELTV